MTQGETRRRSLVGRIALGVLIAFAALFALGGIINAFKKVDPPASGETAMCADYRDWFADYKRTGEADPIAYGIIVGQARNGQGGEIGRLIIASARGENTAKGITERCDDLGFPIR